MNVYVFKTSISQKDVQIVNTRLHSLIPNGTWNFDLDDLDNILRIECSENIVDAVCSSLRIDGFYCEELD